MTLAMKQDLEHTPSQQLSRTKTEVATVVESISVAVLVTHDFTQSKKNDLNLIWSSVSAAFTPTLTWPRNWNYKGKRLKFFHWLEFVQVVRQKELGFWVIRVTGYRTAEWFFPSQLIFIAVRERGSWGERRNQSCCCFSHRANTAIDLTYEANAVGNSGGAVVTSGLESSLEIASQQVRVPNKLKDERNLDSRIGEMTEISFE